ncbi:Serine/threonine-protein kinase SRPK [Sparassis crispa]|uniref:non-specific serine/threonine protein kinase n=1 Tax=Sparassis crispa TaxID=139825 RepID=A0A401GW81_9APHY|nr:Serine/threonine-protein kinase SRPK [Sparassis crispa]GBE86024.1 Serine/threonine-protein kinase SRPK [Sparassis crispa]
MHRFLRFAFLRYRSLPPLVNNRFAAFGIGLCLRRMSSSSLTSNPQALQGPPDEESLLHYVSGGYHPTNLGDTLNERFVIKLEWGQYSTVSKRHVAIKILTGEATDTRHLHELAFLQHLSRTHSEHPGFSRIVRLIDSFHLIGPHGSHLCIVTELLGESVQWLSEYYEGGRLHPVVVKDIIQQVLLGLDYLHKSNIIHTDLKPDNFLIELEDPEAFVKEAMDDIPPVVYPPVTNVDGRVLNYVKSQPIPVRFEDVQRLAKLKVKIADLGVACWADKVEEHFTDMVQPSALRAPEVFLGAGWDSKIDIWNVGCLVHEMITGDPLLPVVLNDHEARPFQQLTVMILRLGPIPPDLIVRGKYSRHYFDPDGTFMPSLDYPGVPTLVQKLDSIYSKRWYPEEVELFKSFMMSALAMDPEDRPSAAVLAEHEWFRSTFEFKKNF